ncbi:MAG: hypothetical protein B7Y51_07520 [Burkholderiales bacterium 28-67-8]|nr:MAG: hypothetical protein B7Y51_07520 [Burkholderiales bacterium 28-67-8]
MWLAVGVRVIGGNKNRLVVEMQYRAGIAWVKFVGTHAHYDRIDVENVNDYQADPKRRRPKGGAPPARVDIPGRGTNSGGGRA